MAQEDQDNSVDIATLTMRCKRGRPRKDDILGYESSKRIRRHKVARDHSEDPLVGQVVSGVLNGRFDAGYMLTVRVGESRSVLRGFVFEPGLSIPIAAANDIAPNVKMFKRDEFPLPSSAFQLPDFTQSRPAVIKYEEVESRHRDGSALLSKGNSVDFAKDLNTNVQTESVEMILDNDKHNASGNLKQHLQSASSNHVPEDEIHNLQFITANVKISRDIYLQEAAGNSSAITPDNSKTTLQEVDDTKSIAQMSRTTYDLKQEVETSDDRVVFTNRCRTAHLPEVVSGTTLVTEMSQSTSESKQPVQASDSRAGLAIDNGTAPEEVASDVMAESSQYKTSGSRQSVETSNVKPVTNSP